MVDHCCDSRVGFDSGGGGGGGGDRGRGGTARFIAGAIFSSRFFGLRVQLGLVPASNGSFDSEF